MHGTLPVVNQKMILLTLVISACGRLATADHRGVTDTSSSPHAHLRAVDLDDVRLPSGFWADRYETCRHTMIPAVEQSLLDPANAAQLQNFLVAAGDRQGQHAGSHWSDGDCYKFLETLCYVHLLSPHDELDKLMPR